MKKIIVFLLLAISCNVYAADLTDQTEDTSPTSDDLIYTVNNPAVTPADRKVTLGNAAKAMTSTNLTDTADILYEAELDTFAELDAQIADQTLVHSNSNIATATALAANPADCGANTFATTIAASGALTCASIADADVPNTITIDNATTAANLGADGVDALTEIAQAIKTAANDTSPLVIGTAGSNGEIAKWNTDGTLTDSNVIIGTVTDGKWCSYASTGTLLSCTQDAPAGSGDITDVFSCASGDCASITMAATDLLNMSGTDASTTTEGLILPQHATACAGGTAEGQVCWEADANILHIGDAATIVDFVPTSAFSGDAVVSTTGAVTIQANSVALTTDTSGNYAAGDAEAGAALTGDSATSFFSTGTLEVAIGGTGTTTSTGTGAVVLGTSPTIATPALTLQDGNGAAPTTDGVIKYDRTAEVLQVGDGTVTRSFPSSKVIAGFVITNGNTAIDATVTDPVACQRINNNSTITGWYIDCDASGSIVLDVWKNTWDDTPEVNADSIAGTEKPTLSTDVSASDTALTSMTTDWNSGQNVCIEIESASTVTKCSIQFVGYAD